MVNLDNNFLNEIGKGDLPEAEKTALLEHLQDELEVRVGDRMTDGLSDAQIDEFEHIIDVDLPAIHQFLESYPNFQSDPIYQKLLEAGSIDGSPEILSEFASVKWLERNRPDYQQIVAQVSQELKAEITANKDKL